MSSTRLDVSNRKKSSKSDWVFIEKLARLDSQLFYRVETFLSRAIPPYLTIRVRLGTLVGDGECLFG